jgi:uncharacterized protein (TIGR02302 family)
LTERKPQDSKIKEADNLSVPRGETVMGRLDHLVARARAALMWERLWRALLVPSLILGLFVCLSFAGLWLEVGRTWRILGVVLLGLAFVLGLVPLLRLGWPSRKEALTRIDLKSGLAHRPASGLDDTLANPGDDLATRALWQLHLRRIERNIAALRAGLPSPRMVEVDRYALRAAVLIAFVACAFLAGPEKYARVAAAFDWHGGGAETGGFRVDAWIDPPPYVGKAPVLLNLAAANAKNPDSPVKIEAPVGSTLIIRAAGDALRVETRGALASVQEDKNADKSAPVATAKPLPVGVIPSRDAAAYTEQRLVLRGDAGVGLWRGNTPVGFFDISAIPDKPPQIQLTDAPRANLRGSLTLSYKISDDYGVTGAEAAFKNPTVETGPHPLRSLVDPPHLTLNLAPGAGGLGEAETTGDLSDHPWAGARVTMTLSARDEGGNQGISAPIEIVLPQKPFTKPIARALVELRRDLVLFPDDRGRVQSGLDALMIAPELFGTSANVYLGLDVAAIMLRKSQTDAEILAVADHLWAMALEIENGDLSAAERELRAAEQKLRDALQNNASQEEIAKLTDELRAAMDKFLKEFAEQQMREQNDRSSAEQTPDNGQTISRKDLQSMLDRMQDMARAGDRTNAQKMLERMQNLLDNLKMAQRHDNNPGRREMSHALGELDKMMRDQQDLRDETHQSSREPTDEDMRPTPRPRQPQGAQRRGKPEESQPGAHAPQNDQALQSRQKSLRDRLEKLQKRMQEAGRGQPGLDDAGKAMQDAEQSLGEGQQGRESAVDAQGRAIESLRREAQNLAEQMQQGEGQPGQQSSEEEGEGGPLQAQGDEDSDPLGRPLSADPLNPRARFNPLGVPAAQRAQRVLEELRKRLSDPSRPREEMDYFERLLKPY